MPKVTKQCERCGCKCKRNRDNYCSLACSKPNGNKHEDTPCKNCNIGVAKRENDFCSRSCAATFNQTGKPSKNRKSEDKRCRHCGKTFCNKYGMYCDKVCYMAFNKLKQIAAVESGLRKCPDTIKQYLYATRGRVCEICLTAEWQGKEVPMVLDHINGDSTNNSLDNLRVICTNCDAQTPTFKSKNKGNGRARRRERYQQGKSY